MMGRPQFALGLAVLLAHVVITDSLGAKEPASMVDELNRLAQHIGHPVPPETLGLIEDVPISAGPEVRALRAALLYRAAPAKWSSELEATFGIHDYAARARGETIEVSQEEFISRIKKVESSHPSLQPQLVMLVAFVRLRDANLWFSQGGEKVSVARFLRGAFLAQVFKGSDLDAVSVANEIDRRAREDLEAGAKSKQ